MDYDFIKSNKNIITHISNKIYEINNIVIYHNGFYLIKKIKQNKLEIKNINDDLNITIERNDKNLKTINEKN